MPTPNETRDLLKACLEALKQSVPVRARLRAADPQPLAADAYLDLELAGHEVPYAVEVKRALREHHIGPLAHLGKRWREAGRQLLICAERIPEGLGEALRQQGLAYLDRGGNAFLPAAEFHVFVAGRRVVKSHRDRLDIKRTEARLLGVFLRDPDAGEAIQKDLAARAGIALGAVGPARAKLADLGILDHRADRFWCVRDRDAGLRRFAEGWAAVIRHTLRPRTYRMVLAKARGTLEQRLRAADKLDCLLGGERAAAHLTKFLATEHATLHVRPGEQERVAETLTLVPDERGTVKVLERYGLGDEFRHELLPTVPFAHPLIVWAECLTVPDDRVVRTARLLRDEFLERSDA